MIPRPNICAVAGSILIAPAIAHMIMITPIPYGLDTLNNSPINADGSDYPCKQRSGVYSIDQMNTMPVGQQQTLSFKGTAVHSGGSCQISVSLDQQPTQNSTWKVIHSIVGGCPSDITGNFEDGNMYQAAVFNFAIPQGFPNGQATLAWTWLNYIGNREFYMNCAPIEVIGGADDLDTYNALPDMFKANFAQADCTVAEDQNFQYPNPGDSVESHSFAGHVFGSATIGAGCQQATGGANGNNAPANTNAETTQPPTPTGYDAQQSSPVYGAPALHSGPVVGVTPSLPQQSPDPSDANTDAYGVCEGGGIPCSSPGSIICVGSSQLGFCGDDYCAMPQDLTPGTSCQNGVISKRGERHRHRHLDFHEKVQQAGH